MVDGEYKISMFIYIIVLYVNQVPAMSILTHLFCFIWGFTSQGQRKPIHTARQGSVL